MSNETVVFVPLDITLRLTPSVDCEVALALQAKALELPVVFLVDDWNSAALLERCDVDKYFESMQRVFDVLGVSARLVKVSELIAADPEAWWSCFVDTSCQYSITDFSNGLPGADGKSVSDIFNINTLATALARMGAPKNVLCPQLEVNFAGRVAGIAKKMPVLKDTHVVAGGVAMGAPLLVTAEPAVVAARINKAFCRPTDPYSPENIPASLAVEVLIPAGAQVAVGERVFTDADAIKAAVDAGLDAASLKVGVIGALEPLVTRMGGSAGLLSEADQIFHFAGTNSVDTGRVLKGTHFRLFAPKKGSLRYFDGVKEVKVDLPLGRAGTDFEHFVRPEGDIYYVDGNVVVVKDRAPVLAAGDAAAAKLADTLYVKDKKDRRAANQAAGKARGEYRKALLEALCD